MQEKQTFPSIQIVFFSFLLFILEFVLFHILQYTSTYAQAILIIGYALTGIGLGGFASTKIKCTQTQAFLLSALGCWVFQLIGLIKILRFPSADIANLVLSGLFFFPGFYLAKIFSTHNSHRAYLFDLLGAGLAVLSLFAAYSYLSSEYILICVFLLLSVSGLLAAIRVTQWRKIWVCVFMILLIMSEGLFFWHHKTHGLDLFHIARQPHPTATFKSFDYGFSLLKSYDNLISRVEVLSSEIPGAFPVSFSGYINDRINILNSQQLQRDPRIVRGLIENPSIFIIGASAKGIVKIARTITKPEQISGIEFNPAIYQIMTKDFVKESDAAYTGINIQTGNILAKLRTNSAQYDVITLMNIHPMPRITFLGPPDFMHTQEFYNQLFERLTNQGYLMIEERPLGEQGKHALLRQINTLYQSLKASGAQEPEKHFFIYSYWVANDIVNRKSFPETSFVGILVRKNALTQQDNAALINWIRQASGRSRINYLNGYYPGITFGPFFDSIKDGTLTNRYPTWDLSPLTRNNPYPSQVDRRYPELNKLLFHLGWIIVLLLILIGWNSMKKIKQRLLNFGLLSYQAAAGIAYITIEILFLNIYQQEFVSVSVAFAATLSVLMISSALGGKLLENFRYIWIITALMGCSLFLHWLLMFPGHLLFSPGQRITVILTLIATSGFLMGYYFPAGLSQAKKQGLGSNIGHYFAFNCIAGAFAVGLCLYCSVRFGFAMTFLGAWILYAMASILLSLKPKN